MTSIIGPTITSLPPTVIIIAATTTAPVSLPLFPWPPPKPSAIASLTLGSLGRLAGTGVAFHDVDERISEALYRAGYDELSYFGVPDGFAIVTRLEKMDSDGYPYYSDRWASSLAPISLAEFSLTKYLEALFSVPKGHYRVLVFIVTSNIVVQSGTAVAQGEAQNWVVEGANRLPSQMETLPYTREHTTTAYIYEFIQLAVGGDANQNIPSSFTGRQHLERAGLWDFLNADCPPEPEAITYGSVVKGEFCPPGDSDIFQFSGSSGDKIRIKTTDEQFLSCIELLSPDYVFITSGCENEITTTLDQTGVYTIWIRNWYIDKPTNYTLVVERIQ